MFTSKIFKVAYAISIAEGWYPRLTHPGYPDGTASYINHNPGNLRSSPFQVGEAPNGYAIFENDFVGLYAVAWQLWIYASGKFPPDISGKTIGEAISIYNDEPVGSPAWEGYISIIEKVGGVSRNDLISSLLN